LAIDYNAELLELVMPRVRAFHRANSSWLSLEEVEQEARVTCWEACKTYRSGPISAYLNGAVRYALVDLIEARGRQRKNRSLDAMGDDSGEAVGREDPRLEGVSNRDAGRAVLNALREYLSAQELSVLEHRLAGFSYAEIGHRLNVPTKTVDNRLCNAMRKLRHAGAQTPDGDIQELITWMGDHPAKRNSCRAEGKVRHGI
jgi:RNA polymerase sigma factor (sigma-70 family)